MSEVSELLILINFQAKQIHFKLLKPRSQAGMKFRACLKLIIGSPDP